MSRNRIDARSKKRMREGLKQLYDLIAHGNRFCEVLRIADARQPGLLFVGTEYWEIILFFGVYLCQVVSALFRERSFFQELLQSGFADLGADTAFIAGGA